MVTLTKDPDNDPIQYSWKQVDGLSVKLNDANSAVATFIAPKNISSDTDLVFQLTVTDNNNAVDIATCKVIVKIITPLNRPPIANAGLDQTVNAGDTVTLDGPKSQDPEGKSLRYSWIQTAGPTDIALNGVDTSTPTSTAPPVVSADTIYTFKLTVTDESGTSSYDDVKVAVKYIAPTPIPEPKEEEPEEEVAPIPYPPEPDEREQQYPFVRAWGSEGTGDGQFYYPQAIDIDSWGSIYVADVFDHRIQKFDSKGNFLLKWGSEGTGDGQFYYPQAIDIDSSGNVYVGDEQNYRIQKFDSNGTFITKWGSQGTGDGQLGGPTGIAIDSSGNVYVADPYNYRIQKFDSKGNFITKWGSKGSGDGQFKESTNIIEQAIAVDSSDNVYVTDFFNNRIQKFDSKGNFITKWGSEGIGDGEFNGPDGIAIDSSDNVYVAEWVNNRIQKFDSKGNFITKWGSKGSGDGQFSVPEGIAIDSSNNVYVADRGNNRIQIFAPSSLLSSSTTLPSHTNSLAKIDNSLQGPFGGNQSTENTISLNNINALIGKADVLYNQGMCNDALQGYLKALTLDPDNIDALIGKADVLYNLSRYNNSNYDSALQGYLKALTLDPDNIDASYGRYRAQNVRNASDICSMNNLQ